MKRKRFFILLIGMVTIMSLYFSKKTYSQLIVTPATTNAQATALARTLIRTGVSYSNVTWSGQFIGSTGGQIGSFTTGATPTNLGLSRGIIMSNGDVVRASQPNPSAPNDGYDYFCVCEVSKGDNNCTQNLPGCQWRDTLLEALEGCTGCTYDATNLQFDFVPSSTPISFKYVFASDEYPDFVCAPFNDVFGFFISGPKPGGGTYTNQNIALIPNTNIPVEINTVNDGKCGPGYKNHPGVVLNNTQYYVNNTLGQTIVYNGFTTVLTAKLDVIPCQQYHIKLAIADVDDGTYDSSVFIEQPASCVCLPPPVIYQYPNLDDSTAIKGCNNAIVTFTIPAKLTNADTIFYSLDSTAVINNDYNIIPNNYNTNTKQGYVIIPAGDSTATLTIEPFCPGSQPNTDLYVSVKVLHYPPIYIKIKDKIDFPPITATANTDDTICVGQTATLSVTNVSGGITPPYNYKWSPATALNSTTASTVTANPTVNITYTVIVKDGCKSCEGDTLTIKVDVKDCMGINEPNSTLSSKFLVYPNPNDGLLYLILNHSCVKSVNVNLFNIEGQKMMSDILFNQDGNFNTKLDISGYAKGVYILKIESNLGVEYRKIIKE